MEEEVVQQQQGDSSKDEKKYQDTLAKVVSLLRGDKEVLSGKNKVPRGAISEIVQELLKERGEQGQKKFKEDLSKLLDTYVQMQRDISNKKKELEKLEAEKKKDFVKAAEALFGTVDNFNELIKEYSTALTTATGGTITPPTVTP